MANPICAIIGLGPGNGASLARRFDEAGYRLALLSRSQDYLATLAREIGQGERFEYDAVDPKYPARVFPEISRRLGPVDTLVYNAGAGAFGSLDDIDEDDFERAWRVNAYGLFAAARQVVPQMRDNGGGNIVVIGATASVKHSAGFTGFTAAKSAQRALAQSLARHLGPERIHVGHVVIDGVVDLPRTREAMPDKPDEFFISPDAVAATVLDLVRQDPSAWTFEVDLRPFGESW